MHASTNTNSVTLRVLFIYMLLPVENVLLKNEFFSLYIWYLELVEKLACHNSKKQKKQFPSFNRQPATKIPRFFLVVITRTCLLSNCLFLSYSSPFTKFSFICTTTFYC